MAEAEVSITYKSLPAQIALPVLITVMPVVAIFLLWSICCIFAAVSAGQILGGPASILIMVELIVFFLYVLGVFLCSDSTVFLTRDGISLPFIVCPGKKLRSQWNWADLRAMSFQPRGKAGDLRLAFKNGAIARIDLGRLSKKEVEDLIVALDVWAGGADSFPALLDARTYACGGSEKLLTDMSFTGMWEDELARRFGATNFIPLEPGHELQGGSLVVERQLAFGGLSAIYLIRDGNKNLSVLKEAVVPSDADPHLKEKATEMLSREAQLLSKLDHSKIARVLDHFVEMDRHYLIVEYLEGQDLRRLVKEEGKQSEQEVIEWCRQIAEIVVYLHEQPTPIVHRDLSPDNVILKENGELALIDFGAANEFAGTATGTMIGKQAYMAPEQLRGKASVKSDIYAFGGLVYFLLTGDDPVPLSESHPKRIVATVSEELDSFVASCTKMEAKDRIESARAMLERLVALEHRQAAQ